MVCIMCMYVGNLIWSDLEVIFSSAISTSVIVKLEPELASHREEKRIRDCAEGHCELHGTDSQKGLISAPEPGLTTTSMFDLLSHTYSEKA